MSHKIIIEENGTGAGGTSAGVITYTPSHDVPPAEQIRKTERATRMLRRINDYLYNAAPEPADEDQQ